VFTAVTMSIGVGTWAFSALKFQADMGILLAFMFLVNVLGAIFLLPALACWLGIGRESAAGKVVSRGTTNTPLHEPLQRTMKAAVASAPLRS